MERGGAAGRVPTPSRNSPFAGHRAPVQGLTVSAMISRIWA